jgi:glycerophosphoryl diester phosphodiesterase
MKTILFLFTALMSLNLSAQEIIYVAHRGASYLAPENTVASIQLAWELDAPAAECDIMLTADQQVILFHDKKGKRLTGHNFVVNEMKYDEIKDYPILLKETNLEKYEGETIPLLSEVLSTIPTGKTLVIEIKTGPEILPFMQEVISQHWKTGNLAFIAFDLETILKTKKLYPEIPCYYLSAFGFDIKKKFDVIAESNLDGVNLRHKIIDEALVQKFRAVNKDMWCWTVDEPEDARKVIDAGVSAITTNRPKWLSEKMMQ